MLSIFVLLNISLFLLSLKLNRSVYNPLFLFLIPWTIAAAALFVSDFDYNPGSPAYLYFAFGSILFFAGCVLGFGKITNNESLNFKTKAIFKPNYPFLLLLILIQITALCLILVSFRSSISSDFGENAVWTYLGSQEESETVDPSAYLRNVVSATSIVLILFYRWIDYKEKQNYRIVMIVEILIYTALTITRLTRSGILLAAFPLLFSLFIATEKGDKFIFRTLMFSSAVFLVYFCLYSQMKYWYLYTGKDFITVSLNQLSGYLSGGIVAFQKVFDGNLFPRLNGANTFRFFLAIGDKLFGTQNATELIQQYTYIGGSSFEITNVYTFYHWYVCDFGLWFGLFMQFICGLFHGTLYKYLHRGSMYGAFFYCYFSGVLFMQFMSDLYFSTMSNWVQISIAGVAVIGLHRLLWMTPVSEMSLEDSSTEGK